MTKDERLDRVDWLIDVGRWDDAEHLVNRTEAELLATGIGKKLYARIPGQRRRLMEGRGQGLREGDESAIDWGRIDLEAYRRVYQMMDGGEDTKHTKNVVTDDLGLEHGIHDGHPSRGRLYAKVAGHVERWQREHGQHGESEAA